MEELLRQNLLALADAYAAATNRSPQFAGREIMKDGSFFLRMRAGEGFTVKTFDRVVSWFAENWPIGAAWPIEVSRPAKSEVAA